MVFLSLTNFYSACSDAVSFLFILLFFVYAFICLFSIFMSVHENEDEEKRSKY